MTDKPEANSVPDSTSAEKVPLPEKSQNSDIPLGPGWPITEGHGEKQEEQEQPQQPQIGTPSSDE